MTHIYAIQCLHKIWYLEMGGGHLFSIVQREKKQKQHQKQTNKQNNFNFALSRGREYLVNKLS